MLGKGIELLRPRTWKAAYAFLSAMGAYHKGDYAKALACLDKSLELDALRSDVNMAFRAALLALNKRPAQEGLEVYKDILSGEFARDRSASKYARAYADYWLGHLTGRPDIVALWSRAYATKPAKGFAARYLPLPNSPILADVLSNAD